MTCTCVAFQTVSLTSHELLLQVKQPMSSLMTSYLSTTAPPEVTLPLCSTIPFTMPHSAHCHVKLKDMMERPGGGFDWSYMHNSPFELSKMALMNFQGHTETRCQVT